MERGFKLTSYGETFSRREIEILGLIAQGWSNQAIADQLCLSLETVKWYNTQVYGKLGVSSRTQAIARARQTGILDTLVQLNSYPSTYSKHNLPEDLTPYIGRQQERYDLHRLLLTSSVCLLTIIGAGGMGKTRLALETAKGLLPDYPDGAWLVDLSPLVNPELLAQTVVDCLGWQGQTQRSPEEILKQSLQSKKLLLLLDNCEHLVEACEGLVTRLLKSCPHLRILATSRQALGVEGETLYSIKPLAFPDPTDLPSLEAIKKFEAVQLFHERLQRVLPGSEITPDNVLAVTQICQRLDGVPLALELAAVHANQFSLPQIAGLLENRLWELTTSPGLQFTRHRSLQASLDWSYNLLSESERVLFRRLAIFSGGWTLEAAEAVAGVNMDCLSRLVQKSLVVPDLSQAEHPRYRFHEITRQYAGEKLSQSGEAFLLHENHLAYYLAFATRLAPKHLSSERLETMRACLEELDNIRKALTFAYEQTASELVEAGLTLAVQLKFFWFESCLYTEGNGWIRKGMALLGDRLPARRQLYAAALEACGITQIFMGTGSEWIKPLEESVCQYRLCQDKRGLQVVLGILGTFLIWIDPARAKNILDEAEELARQTSSNWWLADLLFWQGQLALETGDINLAERYYQQSLAFYNQVGDVYQVCYPLISLAVVACEGKDPVLARYYLEKFLLISKAAPDKLIILYAVDYVGQVAHYLEDFSVLEAYCQEKLGFITNLGIDVVVIWLIRLIGLAAKRQQNYYGANASYLEAFEFAHNRLDQNGMALALAGLGGVATWAGEYRRATHLLGAAQAVIERLGREIFQADGIARVRYPLEHLEFERDLAQLKAQFTPGAFKAAWDRGREMSPERAILEAYRIKPQVRCT